MSDTYTKLFSSITESTVWGESYSTRIVWVTMLAMADASGDVHGSIPGLARRANVTLEEVEAALLAFLSPDPYSRTKNEDGRRIEEIDGGWHLINHGKYSAVRGAEERAEYKREWDRKHRPSGHARTDSPTQSDTVRQQSDSSPTKPDSPTPPTPALSLTAEAEQQHVQPAAARSRFDDFWLAYPNKKGKQEAEKTWRKRKLDSRCDELIAHVYLMTQADDGWRRGFVPMGSTYLNQARWEDVPQRPPDAGPRAASESKTLTGLKSLQGMKSNGLVHERDHRRTDQADVLELGSDACLRLGSDNGRHLD